MVPYVSTQFQPHIFKDGFKRGRKLVRYDAGIGSLPNFYSIIYTCMGEFPENIRVIRSNPWIFIFRCPANLFISAAAAHFVAAQVDQKYFVVNCFLDIGSDSTMYGHRLIVISCSK